MSLLLGNASLSDRHPDPKKLGKVPLRDVVIRPLGGVGRAAPPGWGRVAHGRCHGLYNIITTMRHKLAYSALFLCCSLANEARAQNSATFTNVGVAGWTTSPVIHPIRFWYGAPILQAEYCVNGASRDLHLVASGLPLDYNTHRNEQVFFMIALGPASAPGVPVLNADYFLPLGVPTFTINAGQTRVNPPGGWMLPPQTCPIQIPFNPGPGVVPPIVQVLGPVGQKTILAIPPLAPGQSLSFSVQAFVQTFPLAPRLIHSNAFNVTIS